MNNRYEHGYFSDICYALAHKFVHGSRRVDVGQWQSINVSDKPEMVTREILDCTVGLNVTPYLDILQSDVEPNLPWAEDHFQERISGEPLNPPPSEAWWPFNLNKSNEKFKASEKFSHTYPERFWPKLANIEGTTPEGRQVFVPHIGIRFQYGDLDDVIVQLQQQPLTRQAYLPVWFPEDTGAVHGERVPCTLGYHFIIRDSRLHCIYYIRSCDFLRHFRDDVYMAARLTQWIAGQLDDILPGHLTMHITSFHVFEGDMPRLRKMLETDTR